MLEFYLDVDGVVLDFESTFVDFVRDQFLPDLPLDYALSTWEMEDEFKELDIEVVWSQFVDSDWFRQMGLLLDRESFNSLSASHPLYLVTNIPAAQFDARKENLQLHQLNYNELFCAGHFNFGDDRYPTKSDIIKKLHVPGNSIVFLDDHPKNCLDIKGSFPESHVYLMSRPHNREEPDQSWIRVADWTDFYRRVSRLMVN